MGSSQGVEDGKSAVRPLSPEGMATACRYQAGPQLSFARRPTKGAIGPQLKIAACTSTALTRPGASNAFNCWLVGAGMQPKEAKCSGASAQTTTKGHARA